MKLDNHKKAVLALIIANIIWGAASPIFKWSLENVQTFTLAFLRFSIATVVLLPFAFRHLKIKAEDFPTFVLLAFSGVTFNITFFFLGVKLTPSINTPIIGTAGPIFLLVGCFFILKEKLQKKIILGTSLGLLGVTVIILRPFLEGGTNAAVLGNLLLVLATITGVFHVILAKKIIPSYEPITVTVWQFAIGALSFLPAFLIEVRNFGFLADIQTPGIVGIVFGALLSSALGYFLYHWAIKYLLAQEVGVFTYLDPIVAIVIAYFLLKEVPTPAYLMGAILVFAGIFVAEGRIPYHPIHHLMKPPETTVQTPTPLLEPSPHEELLPPPQEKLLAKPDKI